ncbi:MAG: tetraacyldisaccharide 4'-kinase [Labilithrix sp.]|nr:tetraacyldisaccharide 4'-kinase [Labilithrix sp.]
MIGAFEEVLGLVTRAARTIARPLALPRGVPVVTVGGSTFGGSGKTRLALACASMLGERGARVVLVGHAYRARPGHARIVAPGDALAIVGDEALACARVLAARGLARVRVVVAERRQSAVDFAAAMDDRPDVIVIDGPAQLAPERAALSLLALDAHAPWSRGWDLRAPRAALVAATDHRVFVDAAPEREGRVALASGRTVVLDELAGLRVGLFTALARPDRLVRGLARRGVAPRVTVHAADHGPLRVGERRRLAGAAGDVDLWLATPKCATHLDSAELVAPLAILEDALRVPPSVARALAALSRKE